MAELWNKVPSVVLYEIYSFLPLEDKIRASTTCRHWRHVFYHSVTWDTINFRIESKNQNSCNRSMFLSSCFGNKLRNAVINFDSTDKNCLEILSEVLEKISKNCHLRRVILKPSQCSIDTLEPQFFEKQILEPLFAMIRNSRSLEAFNVGGMEDLSLYSPEFLRLLSLHQAHSIQSIGLASLKSCPHNYALCDLDPKMFLPFQSLKELTIDYDYVNDNLLQVLSSLGGASMRRLTILVHGIEEVHPGTSDNAWNQFRIANPDCDLHLTLLFSMEAVDQLEVDLLHPSMPLTHFKALFCEKVSIEALHRLYEWYSSCLRSLWWVDIASMNENATLCQNANSPPHPLIMAAWKCIHLEELVFLGYDQLDDNIIAIARLRGSRLKRLEFAENNIFYDEFFIGAGVAGAGSGVQRLINDVSSSLLRMWAPLSFAELPPALTSCSTMEAAIEFAMPLIQEVSYNVNFAVYLMNTIKSQFAVQQYG